MHPVTLDANQPPDRFYRGGALIASFRGAGAPGDHVPEDWVASTTTLAGERSLGLTTLPDGQRLVDVVSAAPEHWLGPEHVAAFGADTKLLVKLLDAGERLPVHSHPDRAFAQQWLGRSHGKVEAWHILAGGEVHLGLREPLSLERLAALVDAQDTATLLNLLHRRRVEPGDTVYVPAGTLHAIGEGVFLLELQEPEDLSVLTEWKGFAIDGAAAGHLGLGFDVALRSVDRRALSDAEVDGLIGSGDRLLPAAADEFFRLERHRLGDPITLAAGFAVLIVASGEVELSADDSVQTLPSGSTVVIPWAAGEPRLSGAGEVLVARPPAP